jgi:hypothetical protein
MPINLIQTPGDRGQSPREKKTGWSQQHPLAGNQGVDYECVLGMRVCSNRRGLYIWISRREEVQMGKGFLLLELLLETLQKE